MRWGDNQRRRPDVLKRAANYIVGGRLVHSVLLLPPGEQPQRRRSQGDRRDPTENPQKQQSSPLGSARGGSILPVGGRGGWHCRMMPQEERILDAINPVPFLLIKRQYWLLRGIPGIMVEPASAVQPPDRLLALEQYTTQETVLEPSGTDEVPKLPSNHRSKFAAAVYQGTSPQNDKVAASENDETIYVVTWCLMTILTLNFPASFQTASRRHSLAGSEGQGWCRSAGVSAQ